MEAEAVVERVIQMHHDDRYEGKTFGVISLLGHSQARAIEHQLTQRLKAKEIELRDLVCGDAYSFQGDERDVILLSLVSAPESDNRISTLNDRPAHCRFNVAASRARDQMVLFHSAHSDDLGKQCVRRNLLKYCQNPTVGQFDLPGVSEVELRQLVAAGNLRPEDVPKPFQSWFEGKVFLDIVARGYRVVPQYELAGYFIDLVVQGMKGQWAVECDGDKWHPPERYEADVARERDLVRCGMRFWRVRGGEYELDPEAALESLWETLERNEIYPAGDQRNMPEPTATSGERAGAGDRWQTVQCESLRLTRVRGVPLAGEALRYRQEMSWMQRKRCSVRGFRRYHLAIPRARNSSLIGTITSI